MIKRVKDLGILCVVIALYLAWLGQIPEETMTDNHINVGRRIGYEGILVLGVAPLIIAGGIDLSMGSVVCFGAVLFAILVRDANIAPVPAALLVLGTGPVIGLLNGLLVTKLRLQPFLATLFGLFIYRGLARSLTSWVKGSEQSVGLSGAEANIGQLDFLANSTLAGIMPWTLIQLLALAGLVGVFLHMTVYGRYVYAIGANEQAARYAGVATDRYKLLAYVWCSTMAVLGGLLLMLEVKSVSPSSDGAFYELYAITGAVLGGCSLRGGEGTILGIILGAAVLPLLRNMLFQYDVPDEWQFVVVGLALLLGTVVDELLKRRRAAQA
jgi:ribose transport system permease protein